MAKDDKGGLKRPQAPVDLFTLESETDLETVVKKKPATAKAKPATSRRRKLSAKKKAAKAQTDQEVPREERIKTSVELLPDTLDLMQTIQAQYRREKHKHLPLWRLLDQAVSVLAERGVK